MGFKFDTVNSNTIVLREKNFFSVSKTNENRRNSQHVNICSQSEGLVLKSYLLIGN